MEEYIWHNGNIIPKADAQVDILSFSLHYGYGFFEGVRAYQTAQGPAIFRLHDHTHRFYHSAHLLNVQLPYSEEQINQAHIDVLKWNKLTSAYIRPLCYFGPGLGLHTRDLEINVMLAAKPWDSYMGEEKLTKGLSLKTSTIIRHNVNSVFTKAKATGNYLNSILALQEARACQCDEALMLDTDGFVTEASAQNIFIVENNCLITPDVSSALPGITRDSTIKFAHKFGIDVVERRISRDEVYGADEAFLTGTAAEITPVNSVDFRKIANGQRGPITKALQEQYFKVVRGQAPEFSAWLTLV